MEQLKILLEQPDKGNYKDVSLCCQELTLEKKRNNGASVLDMTLYDPEAETSNGACVQVWMGEEQVFTGYVFVMSQGSDKSLTLRAYDQLRYLKARDSLMVYGKSVSALLREMAAKFRLQLGTVEETGCVLWNDVVVSRTLLDIIYGKIKETQQLCGKKYVLLDRAGKLCLLREESLRLPVLLADGTTAMEFRREWDIDQDTYNKVILVNESTVIGIQKVYEVSDSRSMERFGVLQCMQRVNQGISSAQMDAIARGILQEKNREKQCCTITALGDPTVWAGNLIRITLTGMPQGIYRVQRAKHQMKEGEYTMELEVELV